MKKGKYVTAAFAVSATGNFLPMQLIYIGKTKHVWQMLNFHVVSTLHTLKNQSAL